MALSPDKLTETALASAVEELSAGDADLAAIVERFGLPPLWDRRPGFATLLHIILEQQVSLSSAQAAFDRLRVAVDPLTPAGIFDLPDAGPLPVRVRPPNAPQAPALPGHGGGGSLGL